MYHKTPLKAVLNTFKQKVHTTTQIKFKLNTGCSGQFKPY